MKQEQSSLGYREGERVLYYPIGSPTSSSTVSVGHIVQILTDPELVGQERPVTIHADPSHPRIVIKNEHTGKITAYKPESIIRKLGTDEPFSKGFGTHEVHETEGEEVFTIFVIFRGIGFQWNILNRERFTHHLPLDNA